MQEKTDNIEKAVNQKSQDTTNDKIKKESKPLPEFKQGEIIFKNYSVIKELGRGGMNSIVYLANNNKPNSKIPKIVAVKVIYKTEDTTELDWAAFRDECVTCKRVSNIPNVIKTYEYLHEEDGSKIYIVMEYTNGKSLAEILSEQGKLNIDEALYIFKKIITAIKGIHGFNDKIYHQDLKPGNILLSKDRSDVKIIDFGISTVVRQNSSEIKHVLTKKEGVHGTFAYICPSLVTAYREEQIGNYKQHKSAESFMNDFQRKINEQVDFYPCGCILYEMIMGKKPFYADDYEKEEVCSLPLRYDVRPMSIENPKIPVILDNIVFRLMATKDSDIKWRYHNADEILKDIEDAERQLKNPTIGELLKPAKERSYQSAVGFTFPEKTKTKFYNSKWFFFLMIWIFVVVILATVAVLITNYVK